MKFINKNKSTIVGILVFILVLAGILAMRSVLSSDEGKAIYGDRLDGIKDVEITTDRKNEVINKLSTSANTEVQIQGRIINIIINTKKDISLEDAKKLGDEAVNVFSDKEKNYYDIQIFIENDKNTKQFPIIGYRHHTGKNISWTKDR